MVLVGYSGRDASVLSALSNALQSHGSRAFPEGLYWCLRDEDPRPRAAEELLRQATALGIRGGFVRIPDFDDFAAALYRACALQNTLVDGKLAERRRDRRPYELAAGGQIEPVLKLNAVPVVGYPERCYRFKAEVRGWADLRSLIAGSEVVAALYKQQVFALGARTDIESVFRERGLADLQLSSIVSELGLTDSVIIGMFYDAIAQALSPTGSPLRQPEGVGRSRVLFLRRDHSLPDALESEFKGLGLRGAATVVREVRGKYWIHEALRLSLDYREARLWLLFEPTVFLTADGEGLPWDSPEKPEIIRELRAQRYNRQLSGLLTFWLKVILLCTNDGVLRFPIRADGFEFRLERTLGISYQQA